MTTHEKTLRIARETGLLQILAEDAFSKCEWDKTRKIIEHFYAIAIAEHEREKAGTPRKESASSIRLQMILQLLDDPEHDFTATDMEYWDTLHDRVQAMAREKFEAQALREDVDGLVKEYRPTMPAEVLHLWARDVVSAIIWSPENDHT